MQQIQKETNNQLQQAVEGYAHAIFDPLFEMNEKWNKRWKQMRDGILKDTGQLAEKQLFGALFGDDSGKRGGGTKGRSGIMGQGEGLLSGLLGGLFGKKGAGVASNGGLGSGAGTIPSAAASVAQMGLGAGATGSGGVQIVINNTGAPVQASQASQTSDGGEGQVIQIMLKQLETNGPVAQGILGLISL